MFGSQAVIRCCELRPQYIILGTSMMLIRIVFSQKSMFSRCCCRRSYSLTHHNVDTFARLLLSSCVTPFYCSRNCGTFLNAQGQHILIYAFIINRSTRFSRLLSIHAMTPLPMGGLWYRQARENIWAFLCGVTGLHTITAGVWLASVLQDRTWYAAFVSYFRNLVH